MSNPNEEFELSVLRITNRSLVEAVELATPAVAAFATLVAEINRIAESLPKDDDTRYRLLFAVKDAHERSHGNEPE